jgi:hypothetical protein
MNLPIQIINFAVANTARQTTREDVVVGLVSALRRVRSFVSEKEGFASLCALDDGIREYLLSQQLHQRRQGEADLQPRSLPQPSWTRTRQIATAMLDDAVTLIMTASGPVPVGFIAGGVVHCLLEHLVACLGGPPDAGELLTAVRGPEGMHAAPAEPEMPALVRIH